MTPPNLAHYGWSDPSTDRGMEAFRYHVRNLLCQERLIIIRLLTDYTWRTRGSHFTIFSVDPYLSPVLAAMHEVLVGA